MGGLTTRSYWEKYYRRSIVTKSKILQVCSVYDELWDLFLKSCIKTPETIVEIGAYPGRYIAYLASTYGLSPTALDFNSDVDKIVEAFEQMEVSEFFILQEDFLQFVPNKKYDLVYSLGFIEHFENFNEILDRHVDLLNPGGALLVMVPNKRWFRKWYDYLCDYDNLKIHNTKCMSKKVFHRFAKRNALEPVFIGYFGGFAYNVHQELNFFQRIIYGLVRRLFRFLNPYIAKRPNRFFSSTLVAIFKRPV